MPRSQSAHAIVHAGFVYKVDGGGIVKGARLVFGGLSPSFIRASATEEFLVGKLLLANETLQRALRILDQEMVVEEMPPEPSAQYRRKLALALFYKVGLLQCFVNNDLINIVHDSSVKYLNKIKNICFFVH